MDNINHNNYNKITDVVCKFGNLMTLNMTTVLYITNPSTNKSKNYHSEYMYNSNKFGSSCLNIRRDFIYYMTIEKSYIDGRSKEYIAIKPMDILYVREVLNKIVPLFSSSSGVYAKRNNKLVIAKHIEPITIQLSSGSIMFDPVIMEDFEGFTEAAMRLSISPTAYTDINMSKIMELVYVFNTIDLYTASQNQLNYLGRPAFGTNLTAFDNAQDNLSDKGDSKIPNRKINKNFFDT